MSAGQQVSGSDAMKTMLWRENPVFVQILGICSALAVTNTVYNTIVMCLGLIFTTALSSFMVALLRRYTPRRVRMIVQIMIVAAHVIMVKIVLDAFVPVEVAQQLGPYVGLIITNCIIMGRCEAFAASNPPFAAMLDGFGAGVGYGFVLLAIAIVREPLGMGTLVGYELSFMNDWPRWGIMTIAPGGFFGLAIFIWIARLVNESLDGRAREARQKAEGKA